MSRFAMPRPLLAGLALAVLGFGGAALAADQALIDAAKKEGTVTWYTSLVQNQAVRPIADAFEKKYPGIKVEVVNGGVNDLLLKILDEGRAGQMKADVSHGSTSTVALKGAGLLQPYKPDSAKDYVAAYKDPDGLYTFEFLYFFGAGVNTDLVAEKDQPKTFKDLLDPKWKGKIAWTNVISEGAGPGFVANVLDALGEKDGMDYLKKFADQKIVSVAGNQRVVMDQVIGGQYPLSLMVFNHHASISKAKGAPIKWLALDRAVGQGDTIYLLKGAPHPNAGKLFIDFVLSEDGQKVVREAGYIPAHPKVEATDPTLKPEGGKFKLYMISPVMIEANTKRWTQIYKDLFQ